MLWAAVICNSYGRRCFGAKIGQQIGHLRGHTTMILRVKITVILFAAFSVLIASCRSDSPPAETAPSPAVEQPSVEEPSPPHEIDATVLDRLRNEIWKGDLDGLVERRYIRALVLYNRTSFFYDGPQPRGAAYEALKEFEKFLNTKLNTGKKPVYIVFIPVTHEEGFKRMRDGRGDIAVSNVPILSELAEKVDFSDPVRENVSEIVVTGPTAPQINTLDDLAGKE